MNRYKWLVAKIEYLRERPTDECVEWPFYKTSKGYGQVKLPKPGKIELVHRVAYCLFTGQELQDYGLHSCDNPSCFNPAHIRDGNNQENIQEAVAKGALLGPRKLERNQVIEIINQLAKGRSHADIARQFGVERSVITWIKTGRSWKHIPRPWKDHHELPNRRKRS